MKMGRVVIIVEHPNNDPEKERHIRHNKAKSLFLTLLVDLSPLFLNCQATKPICPATQPFRIITASTNRYLSFKTIGPGKQLTSRMGGHPVKSANSSSLNFRHRYFSVLILHQLLYCLLHILRLGQDEILDLRGVGDEGIGGADAYYWCV